MASKRPLVYLRVPSIQSYQVSGDFMARKHIKAPNVTIYKEDTNLIEEAQTSPCNLMRVDSETPKRLLGDEIRYQCQKCGNCCRHGFSIELSVDELDFLSKEHPEVKTVFAYTKGDYVHPFFNTGPKCTMLKNNLCSIYRNRPFECRYYPFHLVEVDKSTPGAYEFGKKYFQLYAYEDCAGLGKGEVWSPRKVKMFMSGILKEYVKHRSMLKITYKLLTTNAFFAKHKQYGSGVIYGTDLEIQEFLEDYQSKLEEKDNNYRLLKNSLSDPL